MKVIETVLLRLCIAAALAAVIFIPLVRLVGPPEILSAYVRHLDMK